MSRLRRSSDFGSVTIDEILWSEEHATEFNSPWKDTMRRGEAQTPEDLSWSAIDARRPSTSGIDTITETGTLSEEEVRTQLRAILASAETDAERDLLGDLVGLRRVRQRRVIICTCIDCSQDLARLILRLMMFMDDELPPEYQHRLRSYMASRIFIGRSEAESRRPNTRRRPDTSWKIHMYTGLVFGGAAILGAMICPSSGDSNFEGVSWR